MPFHQRSRKKMIMHKYVMDKDLEKYLFEQHTIHGHILETGKTKQTSKNDYHMWCVDKQGNIKDEYYFEKKLGSGGYGAVYLA